MEKGLIAIIVAGWVIALGGLLLILLSSKKRTKHSH